MPNNVVSCPISSHNRAYEFQSGGDYRSISCTPLGGAYKLTSSAARILEDWTPTKRSALARWLVDQHRLGAGTAEVSTEVLESLAMRGPLGVTDRVHRLYRFLGSSLGTVGNAMRWYLLGFDRGAEDPNIAEMRCAARAWTESVSDKEVDALVDYGIAQGYVKTNNPPGTILLTIDGWRFLEQLNSTDTASDQAFVAMWFGPEVSSAYEDGIAPAIREAGYAPMRIDQKEHANRIDDEIIAEIRRSRFVVADFTCGLAKDSSGKAVLDDRNEPTTIPRGGVYYEAGFAQGLGIPVIWMCREDHINHVHFDTRQFNHITWTDAADLREKLKNRIGAVLGDGPHVAR